MEEFETIGMTQHHAQRKRSSCSHDTTPCSEKNTFPALMTQHHAQRKHPFLISTFDFNYVECRGRHVVVDDVVVQVGSQRLSENTHVSFNATYVVGQSRELRQRH